MWDVAQNILRLYRGNKDHIRAWNKMYGQECSIFRLTKTNVMNVDRLREVFGADRSMLNNSKLECVGTEYIPIAMDDLTNAYIGKQFTVEVNLPDDKLQAGDILRFNYLDSKLEFEVQGEVQEQLEFTYKYILVTRTSKVNGASKQVDPTI